MPTPPQIQRLAFVLTLINLGLLAYQVSPLRAAAAAGPLPILRGSGMELVDDQGRLRAQLTIAPAGEAAGVKYAETVIFRLITPDGKPRVKITTSEESSGLCFVGSSDATHVILQADRAESSLKLRNNETTQQIFKP